MTPFAFFDHTADLGLRVTAPDLDTLFRDAAEGLFSMIVESVPSVAAAPTEHFALDGTRPDHLLFDWLGELLYAFETRGALLRDFDVRVGDCGLEATARAVPFDPTRQRALHEVKAITYHGLRVEQTDEGWLAEVVVDI